MSVQLEYINLIVPIKTIDKKYPGGWQQCLTDYESEIGSSVWFDEHLFREGAMNDFEIHLMLERWKELGFKTHVGGKNIKKWVDVCVVEVMLGDERVPCSWLEVEGYVAYLKGEPKGAEVGNAYIIQESNE